VVEAGGYAQAAEALHKSQSAVTYAVQKIESQLGVQAFEIQGRKAVLTATGRMLYRRALALVGEAGDLERAARKLSAGWEAEIGLGGGDPLPPDRCCSTAWRVLGTRRRAPGSR
jgi:DNA-binding transcriptional LysR family regulator